MKNNVNKFSIGYYVHLCGLWRNLKYHYEAHRNRRINWDWDKEYAEVATKISCLVDAPRTKLQTLHPTFALAVEICILE